MEYDDLCACACKLLPLRRKTFVMPIEETADEEFVALQVEFGVAPEDDNWRLEPRRIAWHAYSKTRGGGTIPIAEVWRHREGRIVAWVFSQWTGYGSTPLEAVAAAWKEYEKHGGSSI